MIIKLLTFIKSLTWHIYSGMPKSSQKLINERYNICSSCDQFEHIKSICLICGCNINNKKQFMNKLAWLDQKCPKEKW
jgi:uncharacterized paraquat-inducible protein A